MWHFGILTFLQSDISTFGYFGMLTFDNLTFRPFDVLVDGGMAPSGCHDVRAAALDARRGFFFFFPHLRREGHDVRIRGTTIVAQSIAKHPCGVGITF